MNDPRTKGACSEPIPLPEPVNCEGAEKGRIIGKVEWRINIRLVFETPDDPDHDPNAVLSDELKELRKRRPKDASILVKFYMMDR